MRKDLLTLRYTVVLLLATVILSMPLDLIAQQTFPVDNNPSRISDILAWVVRGAYVIANFLGIIKIFQGINLWSDGAAGATRKITAGLMFLVPGVIVGLATEVTRGNLPNIFPDLFGTGN